MSQDLKHVTRVHITLMSHFKRWTNTVTFISFHPKSTCRHWGKLKWSLIEVRRRKEKWWIFKLGMAHALVGTMHYLEVLAVESDEAEPGPVHGQQKGRLRTRRQWGGRGVWESQVRLRVWVGAGRVGWVGWVGRVGRIGRIGRGCREYSRETPVLVNTLYTLCSWILFSLRTERRWWRWRW